MIERKFRKYYIVDRNSRRAFVAKLFYRFSAYDVIQTSTLNQIVERFSLRVIIISFIY